jgi:hypothetical protein
VRSRDVPFPLRRIGLSRLSGRLGLINFLGLACPLVAEVAAISQPADAIECRTLPFNHGLLSATWVRNVATLGRPRDFGLIRFRCSSHPLRHRSTCNAHGAYHTLAVTSESSLDVEVVFVIVRVLWLPRTSSSLV